jgi:UDP-N-acetylmuramate dehydrogenase
MNLDAIRGLAESCGALFRAHQPLAPLLKLGIGGEAAFYAKPTDWAGAQRLLLGLWDADVPFKVLGGGSNLLAAEGPLPFGVVHLQRLGGGVRWSAETAEADADVPVPALVSEFVRKGLAGLEGMGGIPGSVGGAVIMNAGSFGNDMARVLLEVALIERGRGLVWHPASDFAFRYRQSDVARHGVVAACRLRLEPGDAEAIRLRYLEVKALREGSQPFRAATAGSVFKNPPGDYAGRILESLGFKGRRRGAAGFSEMHANFLVNHGGATFSDAFALCEEARSAAAGMGIELQYEMEIWR